MRSGEVMDPPLEEEEIQPIPDSEDLIGSGEFVSNRSLGEDLWLPIILAVVVANK